MPDPSWTCEAIPGGRDPIRDAVITQLTSEPITSHDVYCEQRYASADGTRIAIERLPFGQPPEVWVCDLTGRMFLARAMAGRAVAANSHRNAVYAFAGDEQQRLMRLDLSDLTIRELFRFKSDVGTEEGCLLNGPKVAVSPDERWLVIGPFHVRDNIYSLRLVEVETGEAQALCEVEDMWNPHHQFAPSGDGRLLVQVNRGGSPTWVNDVRGRTGPEGSTLIVVDMPSGTLTPLPVGAPHTARISGHLCWIGGTGQILFTAAPGVHESMIDGTGVYEVAPDGGKSRRILAGQPVNHVAASDDGRFFIVDDYRTARVLVGSIATGKVMELCDSHTRQGRPQHTHVHPYMTPDNRHVIFNSNVTGVSQVYAARLPEGFLASLEQGHE
jgi:hypothetical protein